MKNLTLEEVKRIPEMLKTMSQADIARELDISQPSVSRWVKLFQSKGMVETVGKESLIDKLIRDVDTQNTLQSGEKKEDTPIN